MIKAPSKTAMPRFDVWTVLKRIAVSVAASACVAAGPAMAGDFAAVGPSVAAGSTTIAVEVSPEFYAVSNSTHAAGGYADSQAKLKITHSFASNWFLSGSGQVKFKENDAQQFYGEGAVGYRFDIANFALKPSVAIGDTSGSTGLGKTGNANAVYYALYLAGDLKLNSQWTWNMFDLRYRNAFDYTWITPKVATGLTYEWRPGSAVYWSVGYNWRDDGVGVPGKKVNIALGLKHSF